MPTLAGWLTGEQVPQEVLEQTLSTMGSVLSQHGGQPARSVLPGAGLIAFSDSAYAMQRNDDPPVLDWVSDRRTMVYRRPLSGAHPLYYIADWPAQGNLLFASEIKALLAVGAPRRLHLAALDALLRYGFIPAPWTIFKDIFVVPAGSLLRWQRAKTVVNTATDYHFEAPYAQTDVQDQLHALLDKAAAGTLPPHEQLVALSGGSSSSALSATLAARHTPAPFVLATFSHRRHLPSKMWKDVESIATACQRSLLAITGNDQPEFWTAAIAGLEFPCIDTRPVALHQLLHTAATETGARVAISGLGAHLLLGTEVYKLSASEPTSAEQQDVLQWYSRTLSAQSRTAAPRLWSQDIAEQLRQEEPWEESLHARKLARRAVQFPDVRQRWYYLDLHLRLPDLVVSAVQQLAVQEHMVVRSPYLHVDVMEMLASLPFVLDDGTEKSSLSTVLAQKYLAEGIGTAKLPLVVPARALLRVARSELLRQILSPEAVRATGIFDMEAVEGLLKQQEVSRELLLVFTTQLLCQLFGIGM
jgi:asparagine synthetase B (glutamine-hydrolysing)